VLAAALAKLESVDLDEEDEFESTRLRKERVRARALRRAAKARRAKYNVKNRHHLRKYCGVTQGQEHNTYCCQLIRAKVCSLTDSLPTLPLSSSRSLPSVLVSVPEEMDSVLSDLTKLLGGWENMYQLLSWRRNAYATQTEKLYIARASCSSR
jgi:hypothetical protein